MIAAVFIFLALLWRGEGAAWLQRLKTANSGGRATEDGSKRKGAVLPRLLPHEDTSYLIEFHSDNCDHCEQMEPVLKRLERDLGTKIRRINIFRRREFYGLLEAMGHDECGGLPFYYNRRTGQAVCGATSYQNLKRWGMGSVRHLFQDPPESSREPEQEGRASNRKDVGFKQMFTERMHKMSRGSKSATKQTAAAKEGGEKRRPDKAGAENERGSSSAAERIAERRAKREDRKNAQKKA